jgi:N-acetylglucosaminyldiphosphoundecaprenol N-acetyl-beta-D-mannosaminyltransferase
MIKNPQNDLNTIYIWGIKFNLLNIEDFIQIVESRIRLDAEPIHITGVNPETVVHSFNNDLLQKSIIESDLVNVDNHFIVLILRILGRHVPSRVATPDLFESLLRLCNKNNFKIYILGSEQRILEKAIENIRLAYPNILINGHHGYFGANEEKSVVENIKEFAPDMLFISMPSPYKEVFILNYKSEINAKVFLGIGGAIDIKAGSVYRAPLYLRKIGLEGLYRTLQNPLYYGKRILKFYPLFLKIVINSKNGIR